MSTQSRNWLKFSALIGVTFLMGVFFARMLNLPAVVAQENGTTPHAAIAPVSAPHIPDARSLSELSSAYASVTDAVRPSVVFIQAEAPESPMMPGRFPRGFVPRAEGDRRVIERSIGSGFVVSSDGYILTNHHVIDGATRVKVRLLDGRLFDATVVGSDRSTDIGVLRIDATGLVPAALGSSEKVRVGEWVLAIGNPLGDNLTFSVTQGIVSAKGRGIPPREESEARNIQDFIQTDAAINQGNSGGPLINVRGEVIGINSAIASTTGSYQGYAFAIPIDLAVQVMNQIVTHGRFERSMLQISVDDADEDDATYLGLPSIEGVRISAFPDPNSPAKLAGMVPGDVIVAIDGKPVRYTGQLQQIVGFHRPGDQIKVTVARKGGQKDFMVRTVGSGLSEEERKPTPVPLQPNRPAVVAKNRLGVVVEPLNAATGKPFDVTSGLLIKDVVPGTPLDEKFPAAAGSIITEVEGKSVKSEDDLRVALNEARNGVVSLTILSRGEPFAVRVRLTKP